MAYAKTPAGRAEVAQRSNRLTARQRTLLIMLDGLKPLHALPALPPQAELDAMLDALLKLEMIALVAAPAPVPDSPRVALIKSMMISSAEEFLGLMAADVVRRVRKASDEAQLQSVLGHWHMAMRESKYGRDAAGAQLERIKACFAGAG
jgi:hypothetical protein